jgi:hypothetical protein
MRLAPLALHGACVRGFMSLRLTLPWAFLPIEKTTRCIERTNGANRTSLGLTETGNCPVRRRRHARDQLLISVGSISR